MTVLVSARLGFARKHEDQFETFVTEQSDWKAIPFGQILLNDECRNVLRNAHIPLKSDLATELLDLLPLEWRHIYKRGLSSGIPSLCRWDPDFLLALKDQPQYFIEVKSSLTKTENVSIEISCILAAILNKRRLGLQQLFVFTPFPGVDFWTYLTTEQLIQFAGRCFDGRGSWGSGTPFILISREHLTQPFTQLLNHNETTATF